jgi:hypothetical protein
MPLMYMVLGTSHVALTSVPLCLGKWSCYDDDSASDNGSGKHDVLTVPCCGPMAYARPMIKLFTPIPCIINSVGTNDKKSRSQRTYTSILLISLHTWAKRDLWAPWVQKRIQ